MFDWDRFAELGTAMLAQDVSESHWRTGVSRSYYALYHKLDALARQKADYAPRHVGQHEYLKQWLRDTQSGLRTYFDVFSDAKSAREWADYDGRAFPRTAAQRIHTRVIRALKSLGSAV